MAVGPASYAALHSGPDTDRMGGSGKGQSKGVTARLPSVLGNGGPITDAVCRELVIVIESVITRSLCEG